MLPNQNRLPKRITLRTNKKAAWIAAALLVCLLTALSNGASNDLLGSVYTEKEGFIREKGRIFSSWQKSNRTGSRRTLPSGPAKPSPFTEHTKGLSSYFEDVPGNEYPFTSSLRLPSPSMHDISRAGNSLRYYGYFKITAYTAGYESTGKRPGDPWYGITATGTLVNEYRTIASDWTVIPPGTKVYIEDVGPRIVEDRGGAVKGNHIDIYIPELTEAQAWGVRYRRIWIIERTGQNGTHIRR